MKKVAIIFDRLGPYHCARLNAASSHFDVLSVELSEKSKDYDWEQVAGSEKFKRVTLFKDAAVAKGSNMLEKVHSTLDQFEPCGVAIPGWAERGALAALDWCRKRNVPAVVMSASTAEDAERSMWKERVKCRLVGMYSAGLAGGTRQADYLESLSLPRKNIFSGYDVVDNGFFHNQSELARTQARRLRQKLGLPEKYFVASNRFIPKKNLHRLVQAYAKFQTMANGTPWKLVLMGDGPLRSQIEEQVKDLAIQGDVLLTGFKQYHELPLYYGLASAFVHASTVEQWGLVVNEAMASGLPVLVSQRCGCTPDLVINGRNGYTFDPFNVDEMARLMSALAADEERLRSMALESRAIIEKWSPATFSEGLLRSFESAWTQQPKRKSLLDSAILKVLMQ